MWFDAENGYQKLPFRDRPLFSRLDAPLIKSYITNVLIQKKNLSKNWSWHVMDICL